MLFKVLVIPYCFIHGTLNFLMVHDKTFEEWTFISGGKKVHESVISCAARELYEETKGVINIPEDSFRDSLYFTIHVMHSSIPGSHFKLHTLYHVFFVNLRLTRESNMRYIEDMFRASRREEREMNENDDARFFRYRDIKHIPTIWEFIREIISMNVFKFHVRNLPDG